MDGVGKRCYDGAAPIGYTDMRYLAASYGRRHMPRRPKPLSQLLAGVAVAVAAVAVVTRAVVAVVVAQAVVVARAPRGRPHRLLSRWKLSSRGALSSTAAKLAS